MQILANAFHPNWPKSRVTRAWCDIIEAEGIPVRRHAEDSLDVEKEQAACAEADLLLFVHPFHWYSAPWMMKRWLDEVLTYGWAYGGPDRLADKRWMHAISVGAHAHEYSPDGSRGHALDEFLIPFAHTARFCRAEFQPPFLFYGAGYCDDGDIEGSCTKLRTLVQEARFRQP